MRLGFRVGDGWEETELVRGDELVVRKDTRRFWLRRPRPPLPRPLHLIPRNIGGARIWCECTLPQEGALPLRERVRWLVLTGGRQPGPLGDWPDIIRHQYPDLLGGPSFRWEEVEAGWTHHLPGDTVYRLVTLGTR